MSQATQSFTITQRSRSQLQTEVRYPEKRFFGSKLEQGTFAVMIAYICLVIFYILQYYTWGSY